MNGERSVRPLQFAAISQAAATQVTLLGEQKHGGFKYVDSEG